MPDGFVQVYGLNKMGPVTLDSALNGVIKWHTDYLYGSMNEVFCMNIKRKPYIRKDGKFEGRKVVEDNVLTPTTIQDICSRGENEEMLIDRFELCHLMADYQISRGDVLALDKGRGDPTAREVASHIGKKLDSSDRVAWFIDNKRNHVLIMNLEEPEPERLVNTFNAYPVVEIVTTD